MVRRRYQPALLALLSYLCPLAEAAAFDCSKIVEDGIKFDLKPLGGPHSTYHLSKTSTGLIENTTFTLDLCSNLPFDEKTKNHCPMGTRVCAEKSIVKDVKKPEDAEVEDIWPIAGEYTGSLGRSLDPKWSRLKKSDSNADKDKEGLRLELNGGIHQLDKKPQKAIIELVCDHDQTGLDDNNAARLSNLSAEDDDSGDGDEEEPEQPKGPLRVFGYSDEPSGKTVTSVLRLEWATKYACEDQAGKDEGQGSSSGWGFFTWFILILFLALAAYLIFGAWLNYNRYGARGWDLMPHGDTIRDVPYILKDWARRLTSSFATGGGRGGYSAI